MTTWLSDKLEKQAPEKADWWTLAVGYALAV